MMEIDIHISRNLSHSLSDGVSPVTFFDLITTRL